ncbi:MAG: hypothetical protein ABSG84_04955 [Acidobacteriaceae bacterium]|jgi:hypothetical protein
MILPVFAKAAEIYGSEVSADFNGAADARIAKSTIPGNIGPTSLRNLGIVTCGTARGRGAG